MDATLTAAEIATLEDLLARLDPEPAVCHVSGCMHLHAGGRARDDSPALAA